MPHYLNDYVFLISVLICEKFGCQAASVDQSSYSESNCQFSIGLLLLVCLISRLGLQRGRLAFMSKVE